MNKNDRPFIKRIELGGKRNFSKVFCFTNHLITSY